MLDDGRIAALDEQALGMQADELRGRGKADGEAGRLGRIEAGAFAEGALSGTMRQMRPWSWSRSGVS